MSNLTTELLVVPSGSARANRIQWHLRHNQAVTAFARDRVGAVNDLRRSERAILSLIAGLEQWIGSNAASLDPYSAEFVVHSTAEAISNALNYDLGRLNAGTLSGYVHELCRRSGADPETGQWIGLPT